MYDFRHCLIIRYASAVDLPADHWDRASLIVSKWGQITGAIQEKLLKAEDQLMELGACRMCERVKKKK